MSPDEVYAGFCGQDPPPDPNQTWLVDHGKDNGQSPGFRVKVGGTHYLLKLDAAQGEQQTAADAIAARLYYAAGFWAPCDRVVYFAREKLQIAPNLSFNTTRGRGGLSTRKRSTKSWPGRRAGARRSAPLRRAGFRVRRSATFPTRG